MENIKKINYYKLFIIFWIMSVFGAIMETMWAYYRHGELLSRTAYIYEYLIPIYGIGALLLTYVLTKINHKNKVINIILIFLASFVVGGLFEVICSYFQEIVLGTTSWNYSNKFMPFFGGRTSLKYCIYWGLIGLFWIKYLYPFIINFIDKFPYKYIKNIAIVLFIIFSYDTVISIIASNRRVERYSNIESTGKIDELLDIYFPEEYMIKKYPNMKIVVN